MSKIIRYVDTKGYVDIHYTISRVFGKKIAKKGEIFMVVHKKFYKGEGVELGKEQLALPIPVECTPEQQEILFNKYLEITKGDDKSSSSN